jgi:hypothetical protein
MSGVFPENAELDSQGRIVYSDGTTGPLPVAEPPRRVISPKVIAGAVWGFLAPVVLAVVFALIGYFGTDDGRALTAGWPVVAQVAFFAAVAGISSALAGYRKSDARYRQLRNELG